MSCQSHPRTFLIENDGMKKNKSYTFKEERAGVNLLFYKWDYYMRDEEQHVKRKETTPQNSKV